MKKYYNDGQSESNILQNRFTAYLLKAVIRKRAQYLNDKKSRLLTEVSLEEQDIDIVSEGKEDEWFQSISLIDNLENPLLFHSLKSFPERDLKILQMKIIEEKSFVEIAKELCLEYQTTATAYYRLLKKLKSILKK